MKYKLRLARNWFYPDKNEDKKNMENLKKIGFVFNSDDSTETENLTIEINTLTELTSFVGVYGKIVFDGEEIIIYNGYLE